MTVKLIGVRAGLVWVAVHGRWGEKEAYKDFAIDMKFNFQKENRLEVSGVGHLVAFLKLSWWTEMFRGVPHPALQGPRDVAVLMNLFS